jgi:hypothetical protein
MLGQAADINYEPQQALIEGSRAVDRGANEEGRVARVSTLGRGKPQSRRSPKNGKTRNSQILPSRSL